MLSSTIDFVRRERVGKTHLACSLGHALVESGVRVKFASASALGQMLQRAKSELKLTEALGKLGKYTVSVLDDIGDIRKTERESSVLFELIAYLYERCSLIITSNQTFQTGINCSMIR